MKKSLFEWCRENGDYGKQLLNEFATDDSSDTIHDVYIGTENIAKSKSIVQRGIRIPDTFKPVNAKQIAHGSGRCVLWKCSVCGHSWYTQVFERTRLVNGRKPRTGCPSCVRRYNTSYPEQFIYWCLKQIYPQAESRYKALKSPQYPQGIEFDIAIPVKNGTYNALCIEYSPTWTHKDKQGLDRLKAQICKDRNIRFIYIKEDTYSECTEIWDRDFICTHVSTVDNDKCCIKIVKHILKSLGHSINDINIHDAMDKAKAHSHGSIEYNKSIEFLYPELSKEYSIHLNKYSPSQILTGSSQAVYWECTYCGYGSNKEWKVDTKHRTYYKSGCPQCHYNWYKAQNGEEQRIVSKYRRK